MSLGWPLLARQDLRHIAAARRKDWYDIAFLLVTTKKPTYGGSGAGPGGIRGSDRHHMHPAAGSTGQLRGFVTQGTSAYMNQITLGHPEVDPSTAAADAILLVGTVTDRLLGI